MARFRTTTATCFGCSLIALLASGCQSATSGATTNGSNAGIPTAQEHPTGFARPDSTGRVSGPNRGSGGHVNINDYNTQMRILRNPASLARDTLQGTWANGAGAPTGGVYRSVTTGQLRLDSIGHGHVFEFKPNGTYAWVFRYGHRYLNCRNSVDSIEVGHWEFDGRQLVLKPAKNETELCSCCAGRKVKMGQDRNRRYFQVAFDDSGKFAVLRGSCARTAQISCVGPSGGKHLRIGLAR